LNRFGTFMFLVLYLIITTLLANALGLGVTGSPVGGIPTDGGIGLGTVGSILGTFWNMVTFQVSGVPPIVNIIFFITPVLGLIYFIIDVVKDLIPFT